MRTIITGDLLILMPESRDEAAALARWRQGKEGQMLALLPSSGAGAALRFIDPRAEPSSLTEIDLDGVAGMEQPSERDGRGSQG